MAAVPVHVTCIDIYNNNIVSIQKGQNEMGVIQSINNSAFFESATHNDLLRVLVSEIRSIDLARGVNAATRAKMESGPLKRSPSQIRLFSVPDGPLGIAVSSEPEASALGLIILEVDDFMHFMPGDVIASVNGVLLHQLSPELAVNIFSESKQRQLTVIRVMDTNNNAEKSESISDCGGGVAGFGDRGEDQRHRHFEEEEYFQTIAIARNGPYHQYIKKMKNKFHGP